MLSSMYVTNIFESKYTPTERVDVSTIFTEDGYTFHMFDCCGSSDNLLHASDDWIDADVAIIVFDLSNENWLDIFQWVDDVSSIVGDQTPIIIVGAKCDLPCLFVNKGMIARALFALRRESRIVRYVETSAKNGQNCEQLLCLLKQYV